MLAVGQECVEMWVSKQYAASDSKMPYCVFCKQAVQGDKANSEVTSSFFAIKSLVHRYSKIRNEVVGNLPTTPAYEVAMNKKTP